MTEPHNTIKIGEVFSESFDMWKDNLTTILTIGVVVYFPLQLLIELTSYTLDLILPIQDLNTIKLANNIYELIRYLVGAIATLGILFLVSSKTTEPLAILSPRDLLIRGVKRWGKYLLAGLIAGIKVLGYTLLLIIPGIYKGVRLSFVDCLVAIKDHTSDKVCDQSEDLVENRWWFVFSYFVIVFACEFAFEMFAALFFFIGSQSTLASLVVGVIVKLVETFFIVSKGVLFMKLDSLPLNGAA